MMRIAFKRCRWIDGWMDEEKCLEFYQEGRMEKTETKIQEKEKKNRVGERMKKKFDRRGRTKK